MKKVLIGGKALAKVIPAWNYNDIDYAVDKRCKSQNPAIDYLYNPIITDRYDDGDTISMVDLYTLKMSHLLGWDINTDKHLYHLDIISGGFIQYDEELLHKLYQFWITEHGPNKRSNLNMTSSEFFSNKVGYHIPHDDLHEMLIKHPYFEGQTKPTYTKILEDNQEVLVSEEKFLDLSFDEKVNLVKEEVMVMAMERNYHHNYQANYNIMLKKFFRSHAPLWEAIFILDNYEHMKCPFNYKKHLEQYV